MRKNNSRVTAAARSSQNGAQKTVVSIIDARHENNRKLRYRYLGVEQQLEDPALDEITVRKLARELDEIGTEFIETNSGIAGVVVNRWTRVSKDLIEVQMQTLLLRMWECFLRWDPAVSTFGTFSFYYLKGDAGRVVRAEKYPWLTYHEFTVAESILRAVDRIEHETGRSATDEEIATMLDVTPTLVHKVRNPPKNLSIDAPSRETGMTLSERLVTDDQQLENETATENGVEDDDHLHGVESVVLHALQSNIQDDELWLRLFSKATENLNARELYLILVRGGFAGDGETLLQVADRTGIGREILRRCEVSARRSLEQRAYEHHDQMVG